MSLSNDPLSEFYKDKEEQVNAQEVQETVDPLAAFYKEEPQKPVYEDTVSDRLRAAGYEPDFGEELERAAEAGTAEGMRGFLSGASFGFSEKIPGLKTQEGNLASQTGEVVGSFIPISALSKVFSNPLTKLASKSPVLTNQLKSLANLTGAFTTGGVYGATTEAVKNKKMPSTDDFLEHGATWALLDGALQATGGLFNFTKSLLSKAKKTKQPAWKVINETMNELKQEGVDLSNPERVQAKAMSILEEGAPEAAKATNEVAENAKKLSERKVEQQFFNKLENQPGESYLPESFEATEVIENAEKNEIDKSLDAFSERVPSKKQLGENIKAGIESSMKEAEGQYNPLYQEAEEAASFKYGNAENTAKVAGDLLKNLEALKTLPEGFEEVIKILKTALTDAGIIIGRNEKGLIENIIHESDVSGDKLMELGRRLNKIIRYDLPYKHVQDRLKPVVQAIKQDVKNLLKNDKEALAKYEKAEKTFMESANKHGKDTLYKIRRMEEGEKITNLIKNPSTLADLKEVLPPSRFTQVERELLEHFKDMREDRARALYRELRPSLSQDAQALAEEIIDAKVPKSEATRLESLRNKARDTILNDLSRSTLTGERPNATLSLWKTKEGQALVKDALKDNPNKKEVIDYLSNQSLKDATASFINPDNTINFKKFNEFLKDPAFISNIRLMAGEEGVNFIKQIETLANKAERNLATVEKNIGKGTAKQRAEIERAMEGRGKSKIKDIKRKNIEANKNSLLYRMDDILQSYGIKTKGLLALLGISKFGIPGVLESAAIFEVFNKMLKSKKLQRAIKDIAGPRLDPRALFLTYENLDKVMEE